MIFKQTLGNLKCVLIPIEDFKLILEINEELEGASIRPTSPDQDALESITRISVETVNAVVDQQKELVDSLQNQEHTDEQMFYANIRETMKQQEKLKNDFDAYVNRTSVYGSLKQAKRDQIMSIEATRGRTGSYTSAKNYHKTNIEGNLNTTVFSSTLVCADHIPQPPETTAPSQTATSSRRETRFSPMF